MRSALIGAFCGFPKLAPGASAPLPLPTPLLSPGPQPHFHQLPRAEGSIQLLLLVFQPRPNLSPLPSSLLSPLPPDTGRPRLPWGAPVGGGASADLGNPLWAVHFLDNKMDETNQHGGRDLAAGHSEGRGGAT